MKFCCYALIHFYFPCRYVNKEEELDVSKGEGKFIRKGIIGDWQNHFTPEMNAEWDAWIEENLKGTGLHMIFQ